VWPIPENSFHSPSFRAEFRILLYGMDIDRGFRFADVAFRGFSRMSYFVQILFGTGEPARAEPAGTEPIRAESVRASAGCTRPDSEHEHRADGPGADQADYGDATQLPLRKRRYDRA
jgi:hypothetical protein